MKFVVRRVESISDPECCDGRECNGRQEIHGELVMDCCDAAEFLQPAERGFDAQTAFVARRVAMTAPKGRSPRELQAWNSDRWGSEVPGHESIDLVDWPALCVMLECFG